MNKEQLEILLRDLDEELVKTFPGPEPIQVLVVGGACLLLAGVSTRPTEDIDVIIIDLFGMGDASLVYNLTKTTRKVRTVISRVGKRHNLRGKATMFLNDDCESFLREMGDLPPMRVLVTYQKLHLSIPQDLSSILTCKLMTGRPAKDYADIAVLCRLLHVTTRAQAQWMTNRYFPNLVLQHTYRLPHT